MVYFSGSNATFFYKNFDFKGYNSIYHIFLGQKCYNTVKDDISKDYKIIIS